jgi:hypothetical protein
MTEPLYIRNRLNNLHNFVTLPTDSLRVETIICENCSQLITLELVSFPEGQVERIIADISPIGYCDDIQRDDKKRERIKGVVMDVLEEVLLD